MSKRLIIGTRGSKLALTQSEQIAAALRQHHPGLEVELRIISTKGDRVLDVALSKVGDKGLFVKELEVALLQGDVDLAVHSCKDLPSIIPDGLTLAAFPLRVDPRDALILPQHGVAGSSIQSPATLDVLPRGAIVGTSSLRRSCQLLSLRPDLQLRDVRGNVDTRLRKLDAGEYDALVLAAAGLYRLGLAQRISAYLPPEVLLPAVTQGILAIEARADDIATLELLSVLDDATTRVAALAERACLRRLEGGCQVPIAVYAEVATESGSFRLRGMVGALDGSVMVRAEQIGNLDDPEAVGLMLAEDLLQKGADDLLAAQRATDHPATDGVQAQPLQGWRVVVTRSEEQADRLGELLHTMGAEAVPYPTIAFAPPEDFAAFDAAVRRLIEGGYDWVILTSVTGVRALYDRLATVQLTQGGPHSGIPATAKLAAIGSATAAACVDLLGLQPALVPEKFVAESLADALGAMEQQRVFLPNADLARPVLQERLQEAGAAVDRVIAYRTVPATGGVDLPALLAAGEIDAITFTSSSTVRSFVQRLGTDALDRARQAVIACIGPVTAETAREAGLPVSVVAEPSTIEGLVEALVAWRRK